MSSNTVSMNPKEIVDKLRFFQDEMNKFVESHNTKINEFINAVESSNFGIINTDSKKVTESESSIKETDQNDIKKSAFNKIKSEKSLLKSKDNTTQKSSSGNIKITVDSSSSSKTQQVKDKFKLSSEQQEEFDKEFESEDDAIKETVTKEMFLKLKENPKSEYKTDKYFISKEFDQKFFSQFFYGVNKSAAFKKGSTVNGYLRNKFKSTFRIKMRRFIIINENADMFNKFIGFINEDLTNMYAKDIPLWNIVLDTGIKDSDDIFPNKHYKIKSDSFIIEGIRRNQEDTSDEGKVIKYKLDDEYFFFFVPGCEGNCKIIKQIMFENAQDKIAKSKKVNDAPLETSSTFSLIGK